MTWTNITGTTTISASRAVTLPVRFRSEPIKILALHPGSGIGGTLTIWDENGRSVQVTRLDPNQSRYEAEFYSDVDGFNYSFAADGNGVVANPGISVYLVSRPAADPDIVNGAVVSQEPISAPNITPTDSRNRVALFGNSIGVDSYFPTWRLNWTDPVNGLGPWQRGLGVTVGKIIHPISLDLRAGVIPLSYQCSTAGTTGAVEPAVWPSVVGDTVADGTAVWTAISDRTACYWHLGGWTLAQAMSGQKFDEIYMVGASGQNSPAILAYRNRAIAAGATAMAYLHMWENDVKGPGVTMAIMQDRFAAFRNYVLDDLAYGRLVILGTCLPMSTIDSTSSFTGYSAGLETQKWHWVNAEIRKLALLKGVYLADFSESYIDPNWATPVYPDNVTTFVKGSGTPNKYTLDGIHPFLAGHFAISKILAKTLDAIPLPKYEFSPHGAYQNLSINPLHYGTGGTGTNVAGSIADKRGWSATIAGATASLEQRTDGINGKWQRVQGSFSESSTLYCYSAETAAIPADMLPVPIQGLYEMQIAANPTGLQEVLFSIAAPGKGAAALSGSSPTVSQMLGQFLTRDYALLLKTPPISLPSNATDMTIYPVISTSGASGIYDIRLGRSEIRRAAI